MAGFADGAAGAGRAGEGGRAVVVACLVANEAVDPALCRFDVGWKGFGAAYLERSFETLVWLGFFWCCAVGGREPVVFGLEEISRAEIWRVSWPTDVMMGFADVRGDVSSAGENERVPTTMSRTRNAMSTRFGFELRALRGTRLVM